MKEKPAGVPLICLYIWCCYSKCWYIYICIQGLLFNDLPEAKRILWFKKKKKNNFVASYLSYRTHANESSLCMSFLFTSIASVIMKR